MNNITIPIIKIPAAIPNGRRNTNSQEIPSSGNNLHNAKPFIVKRIKNVYIGNLKFSVNLRSSFLLSVPNIF